MLINLFHGMSVPDLLHLLVSVYMTDFSYKSLNVALSLAITRIISLLLLMTRSAAPTSTGTEKNAFQ